MWMWMTIDKALVEKYVVSLLSNCYYYYFIIIIIIIIKHIL